MMRSSLIRVQPFTLLMTEIFKRVLSRKVVVRFSSMPVQSAVSWHFEAHFIIFTARHHFLTPAAWCSFHHYGSDCALFSLSCGTEAAPRDDRRARKGAAATAAEIATSVRHHKTRRADTFKRHNELSAGQREDGAGSRLWKAVQRALCVVHTTRPGTVPIRHLL